jgi:hypothetical protein
MSRRQPRQNRSYWYFRLAGGLLVAAGINSSACELHLTRCSTFFTTYMQGKPSCLTYPPPESHNLAPQTVSYRNLKRPR